ncbi:PHP domain-containing protein [Candidatus Micrarchaeota archaeon]|nr:PHP domain-containing protein [Candidatus Micrarchaeota archaeon]
MKIDFHVHTNSSIDSIIKPKDLAQKAHRLKIIPAITDHNNMCSHKDMTSEFIPSEEVRTDLGDLIGLYLNEEIPRGISFMDALDKIHEQGALSYLPHMYEVTRSGVIPSKEEISKIDIIEIFNARCLNDYFNEKAKQFAKQHNLLAAVGSDAHFLFEFGSTYAEVSDFDLNNPKALLKVLPKAKFVTKKAPFFVRGPTKILSLGKKIFKI